MEEVKKALSDLGYSKDQIKLILETIGCTVLQPELYSKINDVVTTGAKYEILRNQLGALTNDAVIGTPIKKTEPKAEPKPRAPRAKKEEPKRYSAPEGPSEDAEEVAAATPVIEL